MKYVFIVFLQLFVVSVASAYSVKYSGTIIDITEYGSAIGPQPYADLGDFFSIDIDYDPLSMQVNTIDVFLESWGSMNPLLGTAGGYFNSPNDWSFANTVTSWSFNSNMFLLESDGFSAKILGEATQVSEPRILQITVAFLILLAFFVREYRTSGRSWKVYKGSAA